MSKKIIIEDNAIYEYLKTKNKVKIKTSKLDKFWTNPGEKLIELKCTGDGHKITTKKYNLNLDYSESFYLYLALKSFHKDKELKLLEVKNIKDL